MFSGGSWGWASGLPPLSRLCVLSAGPSAGVRLGGSMSLIQISITWKRKNLGNFMKR